MRAFLLRWLQGLLILLCLTLAGPVRAAAPADILWVIDTSGSMAEDINEVKLRIQNFHTAMVNAGIDARYGLVRFGGSDTLIQNIVPFAEFTRAGGPFATLTDNGGGTENGSRAVMVGLQQATFRPGAVINVILVTDEDDDSSAADFSRAATELRNRSALFNFIGVPGEDNTDARYGALASSFGGKAFRIEEFRANPQPFFASFVDTKVREIVEALQCDVDRDGDVDRVDIAAITAARNQRAESQADPRDADRDGIINILDARKCTARCTRAACEPGVPNVAPVASVAAVPAGEVGVTVTLDARASSDANGDPLGYAWMLVSAPSGSVLLGLSSAQTARPSFVPDVAGIYNLNLVVSDGRANSAPVAVAVQVQPRQVTAPNVVGRPRAEAEATLRAAAFNIGTVTSVTSPSTPFGQVLSQTPTAGTRVAAGTVVALSVSIGNQVLIPSLVNLTPEAARTALTQLGFVVGSTLPASSGTVASGRVVGTTPSAGGGAVLGSRIDLIVSTGPDTVPPLAQITAPVAGAAVAGRLQVLGTASDANLRSWLLEVAAAGETTWRRLGGGSTSVTAGLLGVLDTTALAADFYRLRLTVDDGSFNRSVFIDVRVDAGPQPGRFELVYTDLQLPNPGLPLTLVRAYDSAVSSSGAFGRSWRLTISDAAIREDANKNVYITLPNGRRSAFGFTPTPVSPFFPGSTPGYTPGPGVFDKLEAVSCGLVVSSGGRWFCFPGDEYDPDTYLLTTREGVKYTISQSQGIQKVEDASGVLTLSASGIRSSSGRSVAFERDAGGRITAIVDGKGARLTYRYDSAGRLVSAQDAMGQTTSYQYAGDSSLITAVITPGGCQPLSNSYAADGKLASAVDGNGQRTSFSYSEDGLSKRITNALGQTTVLVSDARGNLLTETDPEGRVTRRSYDAGNNLLSVTDPGGLRTDYSYDSQGRWTLARRVRSDGAVQDYRREFNAAGRLQRFTTPTGAGLAFSYDTRQNPSRTDVMGDGGALLHSITYNYSAQALLLSTSVAGGTWAYSYDSLGNLLTMTPPQGGVTRYTYDANGQLLTATAPDGTLSRISYDAGGRVAEVARNGVLLRQFSYDNESRPTGVREAEGGVTQFGYSCMGQLSTVTDASGAVTRYRYDAAGRLSDVLLANGQSRSFGYSAGSLLNSRRDADNGRYGYGHTADGLLQTLTTPNLPTGQATLQYNNLQQLTAVTHPDFQLSSTLDILGRVTASTEGPAGAPRTLAVSYGSQGQPLLVNENGRQIRSVYNELGLRTQMTSPDGRNTFYSYDNLRRITAVSSDGGGSVSFQYDSSNRRVRTVYGNGAYTTYAYQGDQLKTTTLHDGSGAIIQRYDNVLSANGYRLASVNVDGRTDYGYDALWRLTSEQRQSSSLGNATSSFSYDTAGNRLEAGLAAAGQRLLQLGNDLYGYDANGNVVTRGLDSFRYDSGNRLTGFTRGNVNASYVYDGRGQRVRKTVGSDVRNFLWDRGQLLAEYNAAGTLLRRYTHGLGPNEVLMQHRGSDTYYYHADPLGSIVAISNAAGQVVQRYDYDAWGQLLRNAGSFAFSGNGLVNTLTFLGREVDAESGLYHLRARAYDARTGRFLQKDPQQGNLSDPRSQHPYIYALNSPTHYSDASGEVAAIEYGWLLKPGKWNSSGALIGFMHGFITPTYAFLGEFFGELNRAAPGADTGTLINAAFASAEQMVNKIEKQIDVIAKAGDPYTFAGSYASGLNWNVGFEIKIKTKIPTLGAGCKVTYEIIPSQGGFKNGTDQGFNYLRQVLHVPSPTPDEADPLKASCSHGPKVPSF